MTEGQKSMGAMFILVVIAGLFVAAMIGASYEETCEPYMAVVCGFSIGVLTGVGGFLVWKGS